MCPDPDCGRQTFTEQSELVEGSLTRRAAREICRAVGEDGPPWPSWPVLRGGVGNGHGRVVGHGEPLVDDPGRLHGVRSLGIDEHKMLCAGPKHHTVFATQLRRPRPWSACSTW